ncbi:AMP-binding enzyme [Streptomyces sp. PmtA]|uniref:AMP-binding enzyme n=1 Tax=Streptomyces sp. PmtA TaxID=3074275 RepID=UPI003014B3DE
MRWLPGGNLEFLGRTDRQLKLRGHRIEPGEVEAVLLGHPSVQQAVAVARPGAGGEPVLAAYVTVEQAGGYASEVADAEGLRTYAASRLPGYMVPVVVVLDELPLTPHGKADVAALPLPVDQAAGGTAPRDDVEERDLPRHPHPAAGVDEPGRGG